MIIYYYSNKTFEYLYSGEVEDDIKELPPFSTSIEPPTVEEFQIQVFHEETQEWTVEEDYRRKHDIHSFYFGGKPFYKESDYWWADIQYTGLIGAIPQGTSFEKMDKPQICFEIIELQAQYDTLKAELERTDYYARRCYEYEQGWDSDEDKYNFHRSELQRLALARPKLYRWGEEINEKKESLIELYGTESVNHISD